MVDVARLREDAHRRAAGRGRLPFEGSVVDTLVGSRRTRRYRPERGRAEVPPAVFLHGGYGLLGDLELQDGYCRLLAEGLRTTVLAVDYRLAPESSFGDSVDDASAAVAALARQATEGVLLCGDSAGGAIALATASLMPGSGCGLLLTNPNVDLTLALFDPGRTAGPDRETSRYAFTAWTRVDDLSDAPRLQDRADDLPPVFVATGEDDSLMPDSEALTESCRRAGVPVELLRLPDAGHGFMGDPELARRVIAAMADFVDRRCILTG